VYLTADCTDFNEWTQIRRLFSIKSVIICFNPWHLRFLLLFCVYDLFYLSEKKTSFFERFFYSFGIFF
jgi:hypothetical protein